MESNTTFSMIKPDAVKAGKAGVILSIMEEHGFRIVALKKTMLSTNMAKKFYAVHQDKPFFDALISFMTSGPTYAVMLEKENAVADFRTLIGSTKPEEAAEGTIRARFASTVTQNAVHGSDSDENAAIESNFFFSVLERF